MKDILDKYTFKKNYTFNYMRIYIQLGLVLSAHLRYIYIQFILNKELTEKVVGA